MDRTVVQPFGILDGIIPRKRISTSRPTSPIPTRRQPSARNGQHPHPFLLSLLRQHLKSTWEAMKVSARQPTVTEA